jgi:hypothetical protein
MELKAKLTQVLPLQTGEGRNGTWKRQEFIVETIGEQYPKKICISIWGDKVNPSVLVIGSELNISFDIESREFNGRWYTSLYAWKVEPVNEGTPAVASAPAAAATAGAPAGQQQASEAAPFVAEEEGKDDLPF